MNGKRARKRAWRNISMAALLSAAGIAFPAMVRAQIIDENTEFDAAKPPLGTETGIKLFSDLRYGLNTLSASNLPGGFEEDPIADTVWVNGVNAYISHPVSDRVVLVASAAGFYSKFFEYDQLDFFGARAAAGLAFVPSDRASFYALGTCSAEFDDSSFDSYYSHCGPAAGATLVIGAPRKFHVTLSANGYMALGDKDRFARFNEASARLSFATGGKVRFAIEPGAAIKDYATPSFIPAIFDYNRTDYTATVPVSLGYRSRRWEVGLVAEPRVTWSTDANYRSWDARFGPTFKVRF